VTGISVFRFSVVVWCSGIALVSVNKVNQCRAQLVLRWVTVSGFNFRAFISVCNQPPRPTQPSVPLWSVNEDHLQLRRQRQIWFILLAGECEVCRLWDPLRTCAILEHLRGVFTTRRYLYLSPLSSARQHQSYGDCLEVKREYYQNCSMLSCVTQCSQSAAHSYEQFLQV